MASKFLTRLGAALLAAGVMVLGTVPALAEEIDPQPQPGDEEETQEITELSLSLSQSSVTLEVDESDTLRATVNTTPADADLTQVSVNMELVPDETDPTQVIDLGASSFDPEKRECSATVKGLAPGASTVKVTATAGALTAEKTFTVTVRGIRLEADGKAVPEEGITLLQGEQKQLSLRRFGEGLPTTSNWLTDNPNIAYVTGEGMVTGYTVGSTTITVEVGQYSLSVPVQVEEDMSKVVPYTMTDREPLSMSKLVAGINQVCQDNLGQPAQFLRGLSVSPNQGTLYYRYVSSGNTGSGVAAIDSFYINAVTGQLDFKQILFVPNPKFSGTAEIKFSAYANSNNSFNGVIRVKVEGQADVAYATTDDPVHLEADDFQAVYQLATGGDSLQSVQFQLPAASQGILYYDYDVTDVYIQRVEAGVDYYRNRNPRLDLVSFVPAVGYSGTVNIPYTAKGSSGRSYSGKLTITVEGSGETPASLGVIHYTGASKVNLEGEDFASACQAVTGKDLMYIYLSSLPEGGTLYYDYGGAQQKEVTLTQAYFPDSDPQISQLTFVAQGEDQKKVSFGFTGADEEGDPISGSVEIEVNVPGSSTIRFSGNSLPVRFRPTSFESACQTMLGEELSTITFTSLAESSCGKLYAGYEDITHKGQPAAVNTSYALSGENAVNLVFVPRAGFIGQASFRYTGYGESGKNFTGTVTVSLANNFQITHFNDMSAYAWAQPSVEFLYSAGIVSGVGGGRYNPGQPIKRGDFALMLCKTFQFKNSSLESFPDVPKDSYYAWAVAAARENGVVMGDEMGMFRPERSITRQDAMVMLYQAMVSAGVEVSAGDFNSLATFPDRNEVAVYARKAVSSLVEIGIVGGDDRHRLNPGNPIKRAEMATVLHHALTL